jgi:hypothetical protein
MMKLPQDHGRFSALAAGFNSIILALAVLIGGAWTLYTFSSLHKKQLAELDFEQRKVRPVVQITMDASIYEATIDNFADEHTPPKPALFIKVKVGVANTGNRPTILNLENSLVVSRIVSGTGTDAIQRGTRSFNVLGAEAKIRTILLAPGNKTEFLYLVDVKNSGIHTIEFHIPLDPKSFAGNEDMLPEVCTTGNQVSKKSSACPPSTVSAVTFIHIAPELFMKYLKFL